MLRLVLVAACLTLVTSHLCLVSPHQRGSMMGINMAGASDCALTMKMCGGRKAMEPTQSFAGAMAHNFTVQKNLCHFNEKMPGSIIVWWVPYGEEETAKPTMLWEMKDNKTDSPYLYEAMVNLPHVSKPTAVTIIVTYTTNAASPVPAVFYQCSDIMIV